MGIAWVGVSLVRDGKGREGREGEEERGGMRGRGAASEKR